MTIDITQKPPSDIFRNRSKLLFFTITSLCLSICGVLLAAYAVFSETPHSEMLETIAFSLFVVPALAFGFFGEKLRAYKRLTPAEEKDLGDMALKHSEIKLYCDLVANNGRRPTTAEYEACQSWASNIDLKNRHQ